jgi:hypothetical protein
MAALVISVRISLPRNAPLTTAQARKAYGQLPLSFEENRGQANVSVDFVARGPGYAVALSSTEAIFALQKADNGVGNGDASRLRKISNSSIRPAQSTVLRMNLVGANSAARAAGQNELEGRVNYFIGNDPAKWRSEVPTFGRVRYAEVYPGIDVVYYGNQQRLEYDFMVGPGRDARAIALEFNGADRVKVEASTGDLLIRVGEESIRQHKPVVYQKINGERREIDGRYAIRSGGRVGFEVGEYDASATLIIDPVLEYSTFLGGNSHSQARAIAVDSTGNAYVTGVTYATNFPTANAFQGSNGGYYDVFVTRLNASGSALVYSTYLGGNQDEWGFGIAVDSTGSAYVTGLTFSSNFPTANAFQATKADSFTYDAFVAKLSPAGSALVYSTYLGGNYSDLGNDIAVDSAGNAYVTGSTESSNFPTANALQSTFGGVVGCDLGGDAFVTKFNAAGSALVYSTYLGGSLHEAGGSIAVDSAGNAYVTGSTDSANFPTANAFQSTFGGGVGCDFGGDVFVTKFNAAGSALVYSTYLGGSGGDFGRSIAVDSAGSAYVTGTTGSVDFPTANALQNVPAGGADIFVTKFNAAGSALVYSTYFGGNRSDRGRGIAVDSTGNAYLTGDTDSTNFPTLNAFDSTLESPYGDAFVTKLNAAGSALVYSSYLGGNDIEYGFAIAVDPAGNAYVTGGTSSRCFPTTIGAFDTILSLGTQAAFVSKISETAQPSALAPCPSQLLNLATRMRVLPGDSALIGGFITTGSGPKRVIIRGIGPSLMGVPGALANPTLQLFNGDHLVASNDDWITNRAEVEQTGIPPTHDLESAIVISLGPGPYTAVLRGQNNSNGIGVVEVYDLNSDDNPVLANIGSRGFVDVGDSVMIGGFIVAGGAPSTRVVIRGIGPSLSAFGITDALQDPVIDLKDANGATLMSNDDWQQGQPAEITALSLAPSDSRESALVAQLPNGHYTAILRGKNNTTGVAVVEVYNVQ